MTICCSRSRENETMSPERLSASFWRVCSAVWPCCWMWTLIPWLSRKFWRFVRSRFAWRTRLRDVVLEMAHLVRDRLGQRHADADDHRDPAQIHRRDRKPARHLDPLEHADKRVEDQRHHGRDHQDQEDGAGGARERPQSEEPQREQHELDPSRDHHRRDRRSGGLLGDLVGVLPAWAFTLVQRPRNRVGLPLRRTRSPRARAVRRRIARSRASAVRHFRDPARHAIAWEA